jgi:hypothetical protein
VEASLNAARVERSASQIRNDGRMSWESRRMAGIVLVILPTVIWGGVRLLTLLIGSPEYMANALRQDLWRAGHAHAGVILILSLITLRYVDEANLPDLLRSYARVAFPLAALLLSAAFFLSVLSADATEPNGLIALAFIGAAVLVAGLLVLGVGLLRARDTA